MHKMFSGGILSSLLMASLPVLSSDVDCRLVDSNCSLVDPTFGRNGLVTPEYQGTLSGFSGTLRQPDGTYLMVADHSVYSEQGDVSKIDQRIFPFDADGRSLDVADSQNTGIDASRAVASDESGNIYILANNYDQNDERFQVKHALVKKLKSRGFPDGDYGQDGVATITEGVGLAMHVTHRGKIWVAGYADGDIFIALLNADGELDQSFNHKGYLISDIIRGQFDLLYSIATDPLGRVVVAGHSGLEPFIARFTPDGRVDTTFNEDGLTPGFIFAYDRVKPLGHKPQLTVGADGSIYVASAPFVFGHRWSRSIVVSKFTIDGYLDRQFNADSDHPGYVVLDAGRKLRIRKLLADDQGRLVVGGYITPLNNGYTDAFIARFAASGSVDRELNPEGVVDGMVIVDVKDSDDLRDLLIDENGEIVASVFSYKPEAEGAGSLISMFRFKI